MLKSNRPQIQITLEGRKILGLFIVSLLVGGLFFALGVQVGGSLKAVENSRETPSSLANLDAREQALKNKQNPPSVPAPPLNAPPAPAVNPPPPAPTPTPAPPSAPEAKPVVFPAQTAPTPPAIKAPEVPAKAAEPVKPSEKPAEKVQEKTSDKAKDAAKDKEAAKEKEKDKGEGGFAVQFASFPNKAKAEAVLASYKAFDKRQPYLSQASSGGKTIYRLRIGHFKTRQQAEAYQTIFEMKTPHKKTMVVNP